MSLNETTNSAIIEGIEMLSEGATESGLRKYLEDRIGKAHAGQLSRLCVNKFNEIN